MRSVDIIDRAMEYRNVPYKHLGRDRHGVDCLGHFLHAYQFAEDEIPEIAAARELAGSYYHADGKWSRAAAAAESARLLRAGLTKHLVEVSLKAVRRADALLMSFKLRREGLGDHLGIYLGEGEFIHADMRRGVVVDTLDHKLVGRIVAAYRRV